MPRTTILTTPRLVLTTWMPEDAGELQVVHSDPETMRFVRHGRPETLDETEALIAAYRAEQARRGWTKWRLADRQGRLIGRAGFGEHGNGNSDGNSDGNGDGDGDGRELGYTLGREHWGQGLATEIAGALVEWHRRHVPGEPLWAYVATGNARSCRVLDRVGLVRDGTVSLHGVPCHRYRLP